MSQKLIFSFGDGKADIFEPVKEILGGKGLGLLEMSRLGMPVPPGFILSTEVCRHYFLNDFCWPENLAASIQENLKKLEAVSGRSFGSTESPLILSIRSGASVSMPGMLDTVLNIGLNDQIVEGLASVNQEFAFDSYFRLISQYGSIIWGISSEKFEKIKQDSSDLKTAVGSAKTLFLSETGQEFPQNPDLQLKETVNAVFESWHNPRAIEYRRIQKISDLIGTAVIIQQMVFGNADRFSGSGVACSRNPSSGEKKLCGEFLFVSQGEDVLSGIRTPCSLQCLFETLPDTYSLLEGYSERLEAFYKTVQEIEFTVESSRLFLLQTRQASMTGNAEIRTAVDMAENGLITRQEAVLRVNPQHVLKASRRQPDPRTDLSGRILAKGIPASPGIVSGIAVFTTDDAKAAVREGKKVILIRPEAAPGDIHGLAIAEGLLTTRGGHSSHAAVIARNMGKPCISGCTSVSIDLRKKNFTAGSQTVRSGEWITLNATSGELVSGQVPTVETEFDSSGEKLLSWADEFRFLTIRANIDSPQEARKARKAGADGIGLCRTEHMFFSQSCMSLMREMIMASDADSRNKACLLLLPFHRESLKEIFREMDGLPVTVRLLDPPLQDFLPDVNALREEIIKLRYAGEDKNLISQREAMLKAAESLFEENPMLGHRGCRLGITFPMIYEMQLEAVFQAACELRKEGLIPDVEILIPLVSHFSELKKIIDMTHKIASDTMLTYGVTLNYRTGSMIETPRAAICSEELAGITDFFSFGTNDLTQMIFGFSRIDAEERFLNFYVEHGILPENPFVRIDKTGVGSMIIRSVELGRRKKPDHICGVCGNHTADPESIWWFHQHKLDFVSCTTENIPMARLVAAQSALAEKLNLSHPESIYCRRPPASC